MSLLSRAQELEDISDAQLAQLVKQGSEAGDTWLAATETQRRKDMRDRYQAEQAKQQAANPPDIMTQRLGELGGGIPSADPNIGAPPDPSLQTGIAGPPQGGPPPGMASGGLIQGYQTGGGGFGDGDPAQEARERLQQERERTAEKQLIDDWMILGQTRPPLDEYRNMTRWQRGQLVPRHQDPQRMAFQQEQVELGERISGPEITAQDIIDFAQAEEISEEEALDLFYPKEFLPTAGYEPEGLREAVLGGGPPPPTGAVGAPVAATDELVGTGTVLALEETGGETDSIEELIARGILDPIGGGGTGIPDFLEKPYAEGRGYVEDFLESQKETPEDRAWDRRRLAAKKRELEQAGGIRSLDQERLTEEERLLAKGMGISEDRVAEMLGLMDTPEQIEDRRKGAGWGGLSSMFLNPDLAAGIGGMGERIRGMDETLREERKTALQDIHAERQTGFDFENLKRKGIFDVKRRSQKEYDTADIAVDNMEATILKAKAERGRAGELDAMKGYLRLLESQASQIGAWNSTMAQVNQRMNEAVMTRDNQLAQSKNWESIKNQLADILPSVPETVEDSDGNMVPNPEYEWYKNVETIVNRGAMRGLETDAEAMLRGTASPTIIGSRTTVRGDGGG